MLALYPGRASNKFGLLTGSIVSVDSTNLAVLGAVAVVVMAVLAVRLPAAAVRERRRRRRPRARGAGAAAVAGVRGADRADDGAGRAVVGAILVLSVMIAPGAAAARVTANPLVATLLAVAVRGAGAGGRHGGVAGPRAAGVGLRRGDRVRLLRGVPGGRADARPARAAGLTRSGYTDAAAAGDLGEDHARGHRGVQRLHRPGHRDRHRHVAGLPDQPGQALALRADHQDQRVRSQVEVVQRAPSPRRPAPPPSARPWRTRAACGSGSWRGRPAGARPCPRTSARPRPSCSLPAAAGRRRRGRRTRSPSGRRRRGCAGPSPVEGDDQRRVRASEAISSRSSGCAYA